MEHTDVERAVRDWLNANSVNPATGVPPDAMVAVSAKRITPFGATADEAWSVTATLFFPDVDTADVHPKIERVLEQLQLSLVADGTIQWRGVGEYPVTHLDAPAGYPSAVDVLLTVRGA